MNGRTQLKRDTQEEIGDRWEKKIRKMFNAGISGNEDEAFDHIPARYDYKPKEMTHAI